VVQGRHEWGKVGDRANSMTCPICITNSPTVKLLMGVEPAFYVDSGRGLTSFAKCSHVEIEIQFVSFVTAITQVDNGTRSRFCPARWISLRVGQFDKYL